jgi:hypothetical protein
MSSWRDMFLYAYDATGRIDEMAEEVAAERRARMEEWRAKREESEARVKAEWQERKHEMKQHQEEYMKKMVAETNLATKDDIAEIKKALDKLTKRLDAMGKK